MTMQTANSDMNPVSFNMPLPSLQGIAASNANVILGREDISGRFSMIDSGPILIQMEAGMVLSVRAGSGSVRSTQFANKHERFLAEGEHFVAERDGLLTVRSLSRSELQINWPAIGSEASSVGRKN